MRFELDNGRRASRPLGAAAALLLALAAAPVRTTTAVPAAAPATTDAPATTAAPATTDALRIRVDHAWIRWLPAGLPAGGYMSLTNMGDTAVNLVAASSSAYVEMSIHRSVESGGAVAMRPVAQITIGPHSRVDFAAAGYHIMLTQPIKPLEPGGHVPITLRFADGSSLTVQFELRK
jgi:copper(I)-binding protein